MAATIKIKNSSTAGAAPTSSDLVQGELAVNVTDKRLYTENASGTVVELGTNPSSITLPDGSASAPTLLHSGDTNTGLFFPAADTIALTTGGSERLRLDSSGNLGLGVTPSAWSSIFKVIDFSTTASLVGSSGGANLFNNAYYNGSDYIYKTTAAATRYLQSSGAHQWFNAPSGTAGNAISFTQAMTLDASGRLGIGVTSPSCLLDVETTSGSGRQEVLRVLAGPNATNNGASLTLGSTQTLCGYLSGLQTASNEGALVFGTQSSGAYAERARIDSSGNLLVGTTTGNVRLVVNGSTGAASFTGDDLNHYMITLGGKSASASTHYQIGFFKSTGSVVGSITHNDTTTTYNTSSDYRLKEVSGTLSGYKERLLSLQPKQGTWKENGAEFRGFLAHEFAESYPSSVTGEKDAVDTEGNPRYQGMQAGSSEVIADLVAYIKELETRLTALEQA